MKTTRYFTITEARANLFRVVKYVDDGDEVVIVNRRSRNRTYQIVRVTDPVAVDKPRRRHGKSGKEAA